MYLVSAFVKNPEIIQDAYQTAEKMDYRFYSFGDAMLLL
jgi:S-adenosylmethionine:tRNA-ribosyltransferase-isomerase (queuine synthetase)